MEITTTPERKTAPPRWLRLVLGLPVLGGWLFGFFLCCLFNVPGIGMVLGGCGLAIWAMRRLLRRREKAHRAARFLSFLLWLPAFTAYTILVYPAWLLCPDWTIGLTAGALLCYIVEQKARRIPPPSILLLMAIFLLAPTGRHIILWLYPLVALLLLAFRRRKPAWLPCGLRWLLVLYLAAVSGLLIPFYLGRPAISPAEIAAQPGVHVLYDAANRQDVRQKELRDTVRFGVPDCDGEILVGYRHGDGGLLRLTGEKQGAAAVGPSSDFIAVDCRRRQISVGDWKRGVIHILNHDDLKEIQLTDPKLPRISKLIHDPVSDSLWASYDIGHRLRVLSLAENKWAEYEYPEIITDFLYFPENERLLTSSWGGRVRLRDLSSGQILKELGKPDLLVQMTPDGQGDIVWLTGFLSGRLLGLDIRGSSAVSSTKLEPGIRFMASIPNRGFLLIGNFFTGELSAVDRLSLKTIYRYHFGPRLRNVTWHPQSNSVVVASALGVFSLDLGEPLDWQIQKTGNHSRAGQ